MTVTALVSFRRRARIGSSTWIATCGTGGVVDFATATWIAAIATATIVWSRDLLPVVTEISTVNAARDALWNDGAAAAAIASWTASATAAVIW